MSVSRVRGRSMEVEDVFKDRGIPRMEDAFEMVPHLSSPVSSLRLLGQRSRCRSLGILSHHIKSDTDIEPAESKSLAPIHLVGNAHTSAVAHGLIIKRDS